MITQWEVCGQFLEDDYYFAIYRVINPSQPIHSGNIKFAVGYIFKNKKEAQKVADELNQHGIQ